MIMVQYMVMLALAFSLSSHLWCILIAKKNILVIHYCLCMCYYDIYKIILNCPMIHWPHFKTRPKFLEKYQRADIVTRFSMKICEIHCSTVRNFSTAARVVHM